jgi:hypothetical protein
MFGSVWKREKYKRLETEKARETLSMEQVPANSTVAVHQQTDDHAKLIRKLRWIGMEDEARRLEVAVRSLSFEIRETVSAGQWRNSQ